MFKYLKYTLWIFIAVFFVKAMWFAWSKQNNAVRDSLFVAKEINTMADLIIFSYDRPMQLYAYLESLQKYVSNLRDIFVIYRTSDDVFENAYDHVQLGFPQVKFYKQQTTKDFKPLVLHVLFNVSASQHFLFGVDDIVMTDFVDIHECIKVMDESNAYGFYLRLGKNITQNYTIKTYRNKDYPLPPLTEVKSGFFMWQFDQAKLPDWRSMHSFDMSMWRKKDMKDFFYSMDYSTPNTFETVFFKHADFTKKGICYARSKMVNVPLNIVQERKKERNMNYLHSKELLIMFNQGMRIDIQPFFQMAHNAPHMELSPKFIWHDRSYASTSSARAG